MIPQSDWKWFGNAGHLCVGSMCQFHLCTQVGDYLISTVGQYLPDSGVREVLARSRGILLQGIGDEREADWMRKQGFEEIGFGRLFETMVFKAGLPCTRADCGCALPSISGSELDMDGYNTALAATRGHYEMCEKAANGHYDEENDGN